ncbi:MAG: hypothetical protein ABI551_05435, partial [Polyangiaceae bacterium]
WLAFAVSSSMLASAACSGDSAGVVNSADAGDGTTSDAATAADTGATTQDSGTPTDSGTPPKDSGAATDSGLVSFPCQATPLPTTAPAMLTVTGGVVDQGAGGQTPISGATVEGYATQTSTTAIASTTSDASGDFSLTLSTGGVPLDGYLKLSKAGELDTYLYPNQPLVADQAKLAGIMVTSTTFSGLAFLAGVTQNAAKGFTAVAVLDCSGASVAGAIVTTSAGGTTKYNGTSGPSSTAAATGADGLAYVFNMTPGDATVMVTVGGKAYRTHHVFTRTGAFTTTLATP